MSEEADGSEETPATEAPEETARAYYETIDAGDYEAFADLLAPGVVHERPDRTFEGRETLVEFMRKGRPNKDTSHEVEAVYQNGDEGGGDDCAVRGHLLDADGDPMFAFVDVFEMEGGKIARILTYTR